MGIQLERLKWKNICIINFVVLTIYVEDMFISSKDHISPKYNIQREDWLSYLTDFFLEIHHIKPHNPIVSPTRHKHIVLQMFHI